MSYWQKHSSTPNVSIDQYMREKHLSLAASLAGKKAVYLDTRFWLILRDAALGKPRSSQDKELLDLLREKVTEGALFCPLSDALFIEVMKQNVVETLTATAELIDHLSAGIALRPFQVRAATEVARYIRKLEFHESKLHPLKSLAWTKAGYTFGEIHPDGMPIGRRETLDLQKSFADKMWEIPFSQLVAQQIKSALPEPPEPYPLLAQTLNTDIARYSPGLLSFAQAVKDEWHGLADILAPEAADIVMDVQFDDMSKRNTTEWIASEAEWRKRLVKAQEDAQIDQLFPTSYVHALLHAAVRWNKGRLLKPNDFPDFQHAGAALVYCDAFFTDGPMCHLLREKHLGFEKRYPCRVTASVEEAIDIVKALTRNETVHRSEEESDWRTERVAAIQESVDELGNERKLEREKWVVRQLLTGLRLDYKEEELIAGDEPCDVAFKNARFQVKELMDEDRRRMDEYKNALKRAEEAETPADLLEHYTPIDISFDDATKQCRGYAEILLSKYGPKEISQMDLLCYFNMEDHHVQASSGLTIFTLPFRSFSVVAGGLCSVIYAHEDAPNFLRQLAGKVISIS